MVSARSGGRRRGNEHGGRSPKEPGGKGSQVTLEFDKYVPELTGDQVRDLLSPVFDFKGTQSG